MHLLGLRDRAALLAMNVADLYVERGDRDPLREAWARDGEADFTTRLRRADGSTLWARMQVRATQADGTIEHPPMLDIRKSSPSDPR